MNVDIVEYRPRAGRPSAMWLHLSHCRASVTGSTQVHTLGAVRRAVWPHSTTKYLVDYMIYICTISADSY